MLLIVLLVAGLLRPWSALLLRLEGPLVRWSERPVLCPASLAALVVAFRLAVLPWEPWPIPLFHDEFSYLLGGQTFAMGRLTNPTPQVARAFETIHTNLWPTYQTMYIPGTNLLMAVGVLLGHAWLAALLATALFCAGVYWMVSGWLPRPYALAAGLAAVVGTGALNWWFENYFCIGLPAFAGTLVLGSLPRIFHSGSVRSTLPLGIGLAILVLTRPYEGFCVAYPAVMGLLWLLRRRGPARIAQLSALPAGILAVAGAWLLFYNWRSTGHALLFPYMLNYRDYHITGAFLFSHPKPIPHYHLDILRRNYMGAELPQYEFMRAHPWEFFLRKLSVYYVAYVSGFGLLLLLGLWACLRRLRQGLPALPVLAFLGFGCNLLLMAWAPFPQYAAPASAVLFLLIAFGFAELRALPSPAGAKHLAWAKHVWTGPALTRALLVAEALLLISTLNYRIRHSSIPPEPQYVSIDRERVRQVVAAHPGKQLCLVRYTPGHDGWQEWVFNGPDPAHDRLVWARSLDPETDRELLAAYPGRTVWLVQPDFADKLLEHYGDGTVEPLPANPYRKGGL